MVEKAKNYDVLRKHHGDQAVDIFIKGSLPKNRTKEETTIYLLMCANCKAIHVISKPNTYKRIINAKNS